MAIIVCPNCGAKNRVDELRAKTMRPVCGKCGQELPAGAPAHAGNDGKPIELTDDTLAATLANAGDRPVLVDCWAAWCGPCRALAPTIDQLAAESGGRYIVGKLDTEKNQRTAAQYRIDAIPAMLLFKQGKLVDQLVGLMPKQAIAERIAKYL